MFGSTSTEIMCSAVPARLAMSQAKTSALKPPTDPSLATTIRLNMSHTSCLADAIFGRNHVCAITVGTTALAITDVSRTVYCSWSMMWLLSLIHISEPTRLGMISYAV